MRTLKMTLRMAQPFLVTSCASETAVSSTGWPKATSESNATSKGATSQAAMQTKYRRYRTPIDSITIPLDWLGVHQNDESQLFFACYLRGRGRRRCSRGAR